MKGQRIFDELVNAGKMNVPRQKGRNNKLIARRNDCLLARYYYYGFYRNKCYEDTVRHLVIEFFLSPARVINIVQTNTATLDDLKKRAPVLYYFQNHWPHLKW